MKLASLHSSRLWAAAFAWLLLAVAGGAASASLFGPKEVFVMKVVLRGPYLDADLRGGKLALRMLFPADEVCARVLKPEAKVEYVERGVFGRVKRSGESCEPVGVASLAAWRDRKPRPVGRPAPRSTTRFEVIYRDKEVVLARGRFLLASKVGIGPSHDLVAMLPNDESCARPIERGEGSLVYRDSGKRAYSIMSGDGPCMVLGFAIPRPASSPPAE